MQLSARDALLNSQFNALNSEDASIGTTATAISTAATAGQTNITVVSPTPTLINYLRNRGYEVRQQPGGSTSWNIDWSAPTDAGF